MRKPYLYTVLLIFAVVTVILLAPWKEWVKTGIQNTLKRHGVEDVEFTVDSLAADGIVFKAISVPKMGNLHVDQATLGYSLMDLMQGQLRQLEVRDIVLKVDNIYVKLQKVVITFQSYEQRDIAGGEWAAENIDVQPLPVPVPALSGDGTFEFNPAKLIVRGDMKSADQQYNIVFTSEHFPEKSDNLSRTRINIAEFPWNGGKISIRDGWVQYVGDERFKATFDVQDVRLNMLLQSMLGDKATGSGRISGKIPITILYNGTPVVHNAVLSAARNGRIQIADDAIPAGNEQVGVVKGVLSDFHYNKLDISVGTDANKKLSARMIVEGKNPAMFEGRPVKLNVQLTGDVLSLLQQSAPVFSDPKQILQQGEHANP